MTYRDPLYDKNVPGSDETVDDLLTDDLITDQNTGRSPSGTSFGQEGQQDEGAAGKAKDMAGDLQSKASDVQSKAQEKAGEMGAKAHDKADEGFDKAASGLGAAADKLREQGQSQGGTAGNYANTVADKLDSASGYLREKDSDQLLSDLEELVRRKPMESLLAAAGIGLLLSRIVK